MPVLDCLVTETVSAEGGEKLLPKLGRQTDAKKKYDRKNYAGGPKLGSYSVDKTNKYCSKLGQTKQSKQQNDPRVDQQHKTGASSGTGSFKRHFRNSFNVSRTGSFVRQFKQRLRRNVENMRQSSKNKTEFEWNLKQAREKLQSAIITAGLKSRIEVVIDGFCGTASSCALYHLKRSPRTVVVGIDRDQTSAFVHSFIPKVSYHTVSYHHRFMFLKQDMLDIKWDQVARVISNRWRGAALINLVHLHLSPSCISMSKADRFSIHRHADGLTPKSMTAIADDAVIEHCVKLLEEIRRVTSINDVLTLMELVCMMQLVVISSAQTASFGRTNGVTSIMMWQLDGSSSRCTHRMFQMLDSWKHLLHMPEVC